MMLGLSCYEMLGLSCYEMLEPSYRDARDKFEKAKLSYYDQETQTEIRMSYLDRGAPLVSLR